MDWLRNKAQNAANAAASAVSAAADAAAAFLVEEDDDDSTAPHGHVRLNSDDGMMDATTWWEYYNRQSRANLEEFQRRYQGVIETFGDLGLCGDEDPEEGATLLAESGAADHLDTMLALLRGEERRSAGIAARLADAPDGATRVAYPCLEFLLEQRVVKVLCELAVDDRPAGALALVLGAVAALLTGVGHPLLPSPHVHYPVARLIAAAAQQRLPLRRAAIEDGGGDGVSGGSGNGDGGGGGALSKAREAVPMYLAYLLGAIWRKLREDSAQLAFFLYVRRSGGGGCGRRKNNGGYSSSGSVPSEVAGTAAAATGEAEGDAAATATAVAELDIFSSLLPLMVASGRTAALAREACLVAVSLRDPRVDAFIVNCTVFVPELADRLASLFRALLPATATAGATGAAVVSSPAPGSPESSVISGSDVLIYGVGGAAGSRSRSGSRSPNPNPSTPRKGTGPGGVGSCGDSVSPAPRGGGGAKGGLAVVSVTAANGARRRRLARLLAHLRFCDAVGYAATERKFDGPAAAAASRDQEVLRALGGGGGDGGKDCSSGGGGGGYGGMAGALFEAVRSGFLEAAVRPVLLSGEANTVRAAQDILTRMLAELRASGCYGGCAVAGSCVSEEEGSVVEGSDEGDRPPASSSSGGNKRDTHAEQSRGPILDAVLRFLFDDGERNAGGSGAAGGDDSGTAAGPPSPPPPQPPPPSLRSLLLSHVASPEPELSRSALELFGAVVDLQDENLLSSLVLGPCGRVADVGGDVVTSIDGGGSSDGAGGCSSGASLAPPDCDAAWLDGQLAGLRVTSALVTEFCAAFPGSPIHPDIVQFAALPSLGMYFADAYRLQIQQLARARLRGGGSGDGTGGGGGGGGDGGNGGASGGGGECDSGEGSVGGDSSDGSRKGGGAGADAAAVSPLLPLAMSSSTAYEAALAVAAAADGSLLSALFARLGACFEWSIKDNVALTGILSALCLSASAAELSPARRRLLFLLTCSAPSPDPQSPEPKHEAGEAAADSAAAKAAAVTAAATAAAGTVAPARTLQELLRRVWADGQARLEALPQSSVMLSRLRHSLEVGDDDGNDGVIAGADGAATADGAVDVAGVTAKAVEGGDARLLLEGYVVLEELLKELFCTLAAKQRVEEDTRELSEDGAMAAAAAVAAAAVAAASVELQPEFAAAGTADEAFGERGSAAATAVATGA